MKTLRGLQSGLVAAALVAASSGAEQTKGPLAGLPSKPGPHMEKIHALGDNEWLNLGAPAADPKWGKGRGRSWRSKMSYAPDLQGAFLVGQGIHGFIKPDGRYDDIFFYDLAAHRWVCIYPGLDTKTFVEDIKKGDYKVNADGQLVDKDGQPVMYAYGGHSYQSHTYDADLRKYVMTAGGGGLGGDQYSVQMAWEKEGRKLLQEQWKGKSDRVAGSPFLFNTQTGKFERPPSEGAKMTGGGTGVVLVYLPSKKMLWRYHQEGQTQLADGPTRKWSATGAKGPTPTGIDFGSCYDSKRDRIYVCGGSYRAPYRPDEGKIYVYDVKTNAWSNLPDKGTVPGVFASNYACVHYDTANDRMIDVVYSADKRGVFVFDPETGAWNKPLPLPAMMPEGCGHGFYSPEVNAHFFYVAGDSQDSGTMWVYRYKRAAK